jgi:hypothetical protein
MVASRSGCRLPKVPAALRPKDCRGDLISFYFRLRSVTPNELRIVARITNRFALTTHSLIALGGVARPRTAVAATPADFQPNHPNLKSGPPGNLGLQPIE